MANLFKRQDEVSAYELFMAGISILAILNIFILLVADADYIVNVVRIMNVVFSFFFLADFLRRLAQADSKFGYFFRNYGWADLLASFPLQQLKIFRLFRVIKVVRLIVAVGVRNIKKELFKDWATSALYMIIFLIIALLEYASIAILSIEGSDPQANIHTASDAIWWTYVTIATVGYGDKYPVTNAGRIVGIIVMTVGVGLFGVVTGFLANKFLPKN